MGVFANAADKHSGILGSTVRTLVFGDHRREKIISAQSLLKTGISAVLAGDFWEILARVAILRRLETNHRRTESPINTGF